ncbi:transglutaminase-like domain-containing protein [Paenibacillus alvei]|uniref:transglutaminase-like domain-containing protein n=1 Tax=Paenibacillus alvei TaxID=44250 RepID=UPI001F506CF7|nr:transglutaminase family protein [Paenibacillus alvei]MBG9735462.1 transglutaminase [Paenibacillus alvei]MBG9746808.1 transglutaminase [Paenibacillus alvei]MCY9578602.1 transglutaminase family protein [Paenibacillus alvei]MCY9584922.1 transglutaminase family protein [Paenibacillus alvei]
MKSYLQATPLVDYNHPTIQKLILERFWNEANDYEKIRQIYDYVRNQIKFGYNRGDDIPASEVLADGYGQCNTKSILLMALLRGVGIPCRIHGFYIDKKMQKGALTGIVYTFAPRNIVHAWTEVQYQEKWIALEGVIIDDPYLYQVKEMLCSYNGGHIGYGVSVKDKKNINLCWRGDSTYIQNFSITEDLGCFDSPDEFFAAYNNTKSPFKKAMLNLLRKRINRRTDAIREGKLK